MTFFLFYVCPPKDEKLQGLKLKASLNVNLLGLPQR